VWVEGTGFFFFFGAKVLLSRCPPYDVATASELFLVPRLLPAKPVPYPFGFGSFFADFFSGKSSGPLQVSPPSIFSLFARPGPDLVRLPPK